MQPSDRTAGVVVLGVDQSLTNTGLVVVNVGNDEPQVLAKEMLKAKGIVEGTEKSLIRAGELHAEFEKTLGDLHAAYGIDLIIHETPPTANRMQRPESSLLAAMGLRLVADKMGLIHKMVHSNKAKLHFTGSGVAKKPVVRERMYAAYPQFKSLRLNEHQADALALVITHSYPHLSAKK